MKITIYSTKSCAYCHMLKNWLDQQSIQYDVYNVDKNPIAAQNMVRISGQMGVPFTTIEKDDGETVNILGFDRTKFMKTLNLKMF